MPPLMTTPYQKTQILMYRALRAGVFPNHAAAGELREWLDTTHVVLGSIIMQSVVYEARKLWGSRPHGPKVIYSFNELLELQYGLEWQICTWLPTFLKERDAQEDGIPVDFELEQELEWLAECEEGEFLREFYHPLREIKMSVIFDRMQMEATRLQGHHSSWAERVKGWIEDVPEPESNILSRQAPKSFRLDPDEEPF